MEQEEFGGEGCIDPPGPSGAALMAAVDGEADEAMLQHVRDCPRCSEIVERLSTLQQALRRRLYRSFCPSTDQLIDYCQGLLELPQRARLGHHLLGCPHCSAEHNLLEHNLLLSHQAHGPDLLLTSRPIR